MGGHAQHVKRLDVYFFVWFRRFLARAAHDKPALIIHSGDLKSFGTVGIYLGIRRRPLVLVCIRVISFQRSGDPFGGGGQSDKFLSN